MEFFESSFFIEAGELPKIVIYKTKISEYRASLKIGGIRLHFAGNEDIIQFKRNFDEKFGEAFPEEKF